ncbi:MAG: aldehyde dehydrogenase family protein [Promethearchaeota archaeon]
MIVLPDANLGRAVLAIRWGCFTNSGQVCSSVKRLYLHESIKESFTKKLVESTKQLKQDNPSKIGVDIGAMVNEHQMNKVIKMIEIAREEEVTIICSGRRNLALKGYFVEPTIIDNCHNDMKYVQEEIFGPVLVIIPFRTTKEAVKILNNNPLGLMANI